MHFTDSTMRGTMEIKPEHIEEALIDRLAKDCTDAINHIPMYRILGCLESVKLLLTHISIDQLQRSDEFTKAAAEN
jgi:hypothetical protein